MNASGCTSLSDNVFGPTVDVCREGFDFTLLFEQAILSAAPSGICIAIATGYIFYYARQNVKIRADAPWLPRAVKQVLLLCYAVLQLALIVLWSQGVYSPTKVSLAASTLAVVAAGALATLSYLEYGRSVRPSAILSVYLVTTILLDVAQARTLWLRPDNGVLAAVFTTAIVLKVVILLAEMFEKRQILKTPYSEYPPEALSGVISRSVFWWINSLLLRGSSNRLSMEDLFDLDRNMTSETLASKLRRSWVPNTNTSSHALLLAIIKCFRWNIFTIFIFRLSLIGFKFSQPLLIGRATSLLTETDSQDKRNTGRALIGATALIYIGIAITTGMFRHNLYRLITMIRGSVIGLIYAKTLTLDHKGATESASLTLMSTDLERIASGFEVFDCLWAGPIEIGIASFLIYRQIGIAFVAPIVMSLLFVSFSIAMRKISSNAQKCWLEAIEHRVSATAIALSNMKAIKLTGLAECVGNNLQGLRVSELKESGIFRQILAASTTIAGMSQVAIPVITLITYSLVLRAKENAYLNATNAFTTLSLVSLLANPIQDIAKGIPVISAATGCLQRIQKYISDRQENIVSGREPLSLESTLDDTPLQDLSAVGAAEENDAIVVMEHADFTLPSIISPILRGITISIMPASWTVITGPIGCGKSMLLMALLDELCLLKGSVHRLPSLSTGYCAQDPWLPNLSVRTLIVGAAEFDEAWYSNVLEACVLQHDLSELPAGDNTEIGSNGVSLSGGQKQRLSLARAVYSRKQFLIMDDVLGGLDPKTEQAIVDNVFGSNGLLRKHGITVILATHSDHVIVMQRGGRILEQGPPSQITHFGEVIIETPVSQDTIRGPAHMKDPSTSSHRQQEQERELAEEEMTFELTRQGGDVRLYAYYMRAIGWTNSISVILFFCACSVFMKFPTVWVNWWTAAEANDPGAHTDAYAGIYGLFCGLCLLVFSAGMGVLFLFGIPRSSNSLHAKLLDAVVRAPYWFFVSSDTGQILNRFSQDMSLVCLQLPFAMLDTIFNAGVCIVGAALITTASKYSTAMLPPLFLVMYVLQKFYLRTSRQIRLLDLETKSPLYSYFLQTLQGTVTIRAFGWQESCTKELAALLDRSQRPYYLMYSIQRWLNLVLDLLVAGIATVVIALATQLSGSSAGSLGVALVSILSFSMDLTYLIRTWTDLETSLGAIARVKSFESDTPSENLAGEEGDVPAGWPSEGNIEIQGLSSSYKLNNALVLKNVNLDIKAGSKVGICGRTGSGKSTIILTLLRMAEIESGDILIDGISIKTIPRNALRQQLVAMPQDPLQLTGTVRFNVDPFAKYADESILSALQEVEILDVITAAGGLDVPLDTVPLSRGQQQLFSLARPILSNSRVVVLDEMTSSVDAITEAKMMEVVNRKFSGRTVIAVAHHLCTIRDFNTIVVLDQGRVVETGSPDELLQRDSIFRELWEKNQ